VQRPNKDRAGATPSTTGVRRASAAKDRRRRRRSLTLSGSAYALRGDTERGIAERLEARRLSGCDFYHSIAHLTALADYGVPAIRALFEATYFAGLRKAGMPEE
jgi:hypothetical protein